MDVSTYHNGKIIGKCSIFKENGKVHCSFSCPFEQNKILRLFLQLEGGQTVPMGVLQPDGRNFTVKKTLQTREVGVNGEKVLRANLERKTIGSHNTPPLHFSFDQFKPLNFDLVTTDHALQNCTQDRGGLLYYSDEKGRFLAAPIVGGVAFELAAFFCLITVVEYENHLFGVLELNEENLPIYLNKTAD